MEESDDDVDVAILSLGCIVAAQYLLLDMESDVEERARKRSAVPRNVEPIEERDPLKTLHNSDKSFYIATRLTKAEFEALHEELLPILEDRVYMSRNSSTKRVLFLLLEWLAHTDTFSSLVEKWGGSESTLCRMLHEMLPLISTYLYEKHVKWLTDVEKQAQRDCFVGLKGVIAAVDCIRFPIARGTSKRESNRFYSVDKKILCVKAQVWCDWRGRILHVLADPEICRGRKHELTILRDSPVAVRHIEYFGDDYKGIGDAAYIGAVPPTSMVILCPISRRERGFDIDYNKLVARNRIIIENVFGHVLARWKRLFHHQWELGGSSEGPRRYELLEECVRLVFALTQRLFESRGYPRDAEWLEGRLMKWEEADYVAAYVEEGGRQGANIAEQIAVDLDQDTE